MTGHRASERDERGWIARRVGEDPVRAVAVVLIVAQLAWRAEITFRGFLSQDDFVLASRAAASKLTVDFLLDVFSNHLMPGGMLIYWLVTHEAGLVYWPYALLLLVGQAALSVAFYRLLRLLVQPGWGLLIPLGVLLFSPLTLEVTSWWVFGVNMLPMQLAMVLAIGAQVKFVRTRRARHLVTLALSLLFGLFFFEKSLLIVPLVFLLTACLLVTGGPIRSIARTVRLYWPSWLVLIAISAAYLALYLSRPVPACTPLSCPSTLRRPTSVGQVVTFVDQLVGSTLIPGILGGPWRWLSVGGGSGLVDPGEVLRWLSWAAFLALVVVTVWRRPSAARAWVLFIGYVAIATTLLAATRLGAVLSALAGLVTRYTSDMVVVAAICIGVALLGLRDAADHAPARSRTWPAALREPRATGYVLAFAALATLGLGAVWSAARFADGWAVNPGRDYLSAAKADLAAAPPGTVFFDQTIPDRVVAAYFYPDNLQSHFFRTLEPGPMFVSETENLSIFDDAGHIRRARVEGLTNQPGPVPELSCGYKISEGKTVVIPLNGSTIEWEWAVRIGYLSTGNSTATLRLGGSTHRFEVHRGPQQIFFLLKGSGRAVELTVNDPTVILCTNEISIGKPVPWL